MKLHLIDGTEVEIFRQTCAHYISSKYDNDVCNWSIINYDIGFFAIGHWGCDGYRDTTGKYIRTPEKFKVLIPIKSVSYITDIEKWEKPDEKNYGLKG